MMDELKDLSIRAVKGLMSRRDFMGRASALGVSAGMAGTLLSSAVHAAGAQKGGMLKAGLQGGESTNSLDPATWASSVPSVYGFCWGETLVGISPEGEVNGRLAESFEASADAKTWRFKMRKGVEFHNGKTVTAEDALATMQRHSGEDTKSGALGIMRGIESMSVDGDTLVLDLKTPNADLPYLMSDYHLVIQPNGGMDDPTAGIGTGAYTVEINEPGVRHSGKKFANYWDDERGHADEVEIIVINDSTARTAALQGGQVDMINRVEPKIVDLVKRVPGVTIRNVSGRGHYVMIMHCDTGPFDNNDLRLALKYSVDRQEMVDKILRGYGSIGNDMPVNSAYPLFDETIPQREFDLDKAAFHYKKSGHDGSPIVLRTSDGAFPGAVDAAALLQQTTKKAGIPLEVKREPNDGYWSEVWNKQPFCCSYWGGRPVQDQMYSVAYLSTADWNDTRFNNSRFDELLLAARGELDLAKRKSMYSEMGYLVRDEGGLICPMYNDFISATGPRVGGWIDDPNYDLSNGLGLVRSWVIS
ncbi:MAG: ABC transporter substrate-binding protein [Pseudomonadota bacterium]